MSAHLTLKYSMMVQFIYRMCFEIMKYLNVQTEQVFNGKEKELWNGLSHEKTSILCSVLLNVPAYRKGNGVWAPIPPAPP